MRSLTTVVSCNTSLTDIASLLGYHIILWVGVVQNVLDSFKHLVVAHHYCSWNWAKNSWSRMELSPTANFTETWALLFHNWGCSDLFGTTSVTDSFNVQGVSSHSGQLCVIYITMQEALSLRLMNYIILQVLMFRFSVVFGVTQFFPLFCDFFLTSSFSELSTHFHWNR